jgi:hypothetical protein
MWDTSLVNGQKLPALRACREFLSLCRMGHRGEMEILSKLRVRVEEFRKTVWPPLHSAIMRIGPLIEHIFCH